MTFTLGLNAYHGDSSACIFKGKKLVAAVEEERFRRIKHWAGFPSQAIQYCLDEAGITLEDVGHIAINTAPKAALLRKIGYVITNKPELGLISNRASNASRRLSLKDEFKRSFPGQKINAKFHNIEHHLAHMASAYLVSPFKEATVVSVDGFGDFSSAAWGIGRGDKIEIEGRVHFPHSLGIFYQAMTQFLGFPHYGDEYKVMGLAPYGKPKYLEELKKIVLMRENGAFSLDTSYFRHHRENIGYEWTDGSPSVGVLYSKKMEELLGIARKPTDELEQKHKDIAHSVQAMYEIAFFNLIDALHRRHGIDALALAGGCAMNSVANGKVLRNSTFQRLYVQSAAGDAGGAIGAALVVASRLSDAGETAAIQHGALASDPDLRREVMDHAYWGPQFSNEQIETVLEESKVRISDAGCVVEKIKDETELYRLTAEAIGGGQVVGWFQGRMEWGPRALGNRSIVCDPRRTDMKQILNSKIKRRESFRPFAPSVLREETSVWFEEDADVPFMMQVFQVREEKRAMLPAVTHADGSGRLQTVYRQTNPRYWNLISEFNRQTGVPMLLNTSFNENEPVVCQPIEALDCFLRTKMDLLVLGDWMIRRPANRQG